MAENFNGVSLEDVAFKKKPELTPDERKVADIFDNLLSASQDLGGQALKTEESLREFVEGLNGTYFSGSIPGSGVEGDSFSSKNDEAVYRGTLDDGRVVRVVSVGGSKSQGLPPRLEVVIE